MSAAGQRARVVPALALAITAISFAAIFFRKAAPTHPLVAAGVRLAVATILLSPMVLRARRDGRLPGPVIRSAAWGGLAYAVHFGAWVTSLTMTTVAASVTLVSATPVLLAAGERAELATDEYLPMTSVLEGVVILKKNPDHVPTALDEGKKKPEAAASPTQIGKITKPLSHW